MVCLGQGFVKVKVCQGLSRVVIKGVLGFVVVGIFFSWVFFSWGWGGFVGGVVSGASGGGGFSWFFSWI